MTAPRVQLLLIGAGRSGTTSLADWMDQHPQVNWSPVKELPFFSVPELYSRGESYLHGLFEPVEDKLWATSDTHLLAAPHGPQNVHAYNPKCKIVALLRDPVERAYSAYRYSVAAGYHADYGFEHVLEKEEDAVASGNASTIANHAHLYVSRYAHHLDRWNRYFPKDQILLLTTAELRAEPEIAMKKVEDFLELEHHSGYEFTRSNEGQGFKSAALHRFLANRNHPLRKTLRWLIRPFSKIILKSHLVERVKRMNKTPQQAVPLDPAIYQKLRATLADDIGRLESEWDIKL